jgi:2,4-diaminopentanoate dehydrogenase
MTGRPYRVVQWATGEIGGRALREVIRHPDLELVGLVVYGKDKAGLDAGTLCGEPPTGVIATTDRGSVPGLGADCVLYMPGAYDLDDVVALLAAGTNVVTTCGDFFAGGRPLGEEGRGRVLEACEQGGSSIYATGSSPGFISEALPLTLLSLQRKVDCVMIEEYANISQRDSPHMIFEQMGFGKPIGPAATARSEYLKSQFSPSLSLIGAAAGRPVEEWSAHGELAAATHDVTIAAGVVKAGTVGAMRTTILGTSGGTVAVSFSATWYCTQDIDAEWDMLNTGWRVKVEGDTPLKVTVEFPVPLEELGGMTPGLTAHRPVNAVIAVCQAAPGFVSTVDLPVLTPVSPPAA